MTLMIFLLTSQSFFFALTESWSVFVDLIGLQFEASWVITNIASGSTLQTRAVIDAGAISPLIQLLLSPHEHIREQVIHAAG